MEANMILIALADYNKLLADKLFADRVRRKLKKKARTDNQYLSLTVYPEDVPGCEDMEEEDESV